MAATQTRETITLEFVGEKRSNKAIALGVTWEDGRLAAKTLFDALRNAGIEPGEHFFRNLYLDGPAWTVNAVTLDYLLWLAPGPCKIVALGRRVAVELKRYNIPHIVLIHPAARGAIRARSSYHAHVASALAPFLEAL